jgi:hypothetical protein
MKMHILAALALVTAFAATSALPARAGSHESTIKVTDISKGGWIWVTSYSHGVNKGAFCVAPNTTGERTFQANITTILFEVGRQNCSHPLWATLGPYHGPDPRPYSSTKHNRITCDDRGCYVQ